MSGTLYPWLTPHWEQLRAQLLDGRFPHALILTGASGIGKQQLLQQLASYLLCQSPAGSACGRCSGCQLVQADTHPDLLMLDGSEKKIGVDEIRACTQMLTERAHQQAARVVVIHAAQQMTENAANALLKTLEEPGEQSYLLLDAVSSGELPATITSRCQVEHLPLPDAEVALNWLHTQQCAAQPMHLKINRGAPLNVLAFFEQEMDSQCQRFIHQLNRLLATGEVQEALVEQFVALGEVAFDWLWFYLSDLQKAKAGLSAKHRVFSEHAVEQDRLITEVNFHWFERGILALPEWRRTLAMPGINASLQIRSLLNLWCQSRLVA